MASSTVLAVYDAVKAISVQYNGATPNIYDLDQLPANGDSARLPARMLLPFGNFFETGRVAETVMVTIPGNVVNVQWQLRDLLLVRAIAQGEGIYSVADKLVAYAGAYVAAMVNRTDIQRKLTGQAYIDNITCTPGVYEYPEGGGRFYFGVNCVLTIRELIA